MCVSACVLYDLKSLGFDYDSYNLNSKDGKSRVSSICQWLYLRLFLLEASAMFFQNEYLKKMACPTLCTRPSAVSAPVAQG